MERMVNSSTATTYYIITSLDSANIQKLKFPNLVFVYQNNIAVVSSNIYYYVHVLTSYYSYKNNT